VIALLERPLRRKLVGEPPSMEYVPVVEAMGNSLGMKLYQLRETPTQRER
jgi:hypothetical protein